ncbi:MAG: hypothetical protein JNM59_05125 [Hyphomonadaceae bacterium]|nr:hypothetical protein [Hyphomonadaceae bacterium]
MAGRGKSIFINCPYDRAYGKRFWGLTFAVLDAGFVPRAAIEIDNGAQSRFDKIIKIVRECPLSIHDLCRADTPRFNMPFEVGLAVAMANGAARTRKRLLILATSKKKFEATCSDLKGIDPSIYRGDPVRATTTWLQQFFDPRRTFPSPLQTKSRFDSFWAGLPRVARAWGFDHRNPTWVERQGAIHSFLESHPLRRGRP